MQLGQAGVREFLVLQRLRQNADRLATGGEDRVGHRSHQPDGGAAIDEADAFPRQCSAQERRCFAIGRQTAEVRSAKDANAHDALIE